MDKNFIYSENTGEICGHYYLKDIKENGECNLLSFPYFNTKYNKVFNYYTSCEKEYKEMLNDILKEINK